MSIMDQVYKAEPKTVTTNSIMMRINVNGQAYYGFANCHPDDQDFYSEKVGSTIAHMRAEINAFRDLRDHAAYEWKTLKKAFADAYQNNATPCPQFQKAVWQAENRYRKYQQAVKDMRATLSNYLKNQDKVISSLRRQREQKAKTN